MSKARWKLCIELSQSGRRFLRCDLFVKEDDKVPFSPALYFAMCLDVGLKKEIGPYNRGQGLALGVPRRTDCHGGSNLGEITLHGVTQCLNKCI